EFAENIRQDEMAADYYGSLALLRQMKETPVGQRRSLVIESLKNVCEQGRSSKRINTLIFGEVNEPLYPPARFRVENALRNSELRAGLGCQAYTKTDRPWCDLQGASEN
ncbi:MAG: hypothetical protein H7333_00545, partial [Bdellovibrionales bacterium]|nr:hypothetical protein [Oligoflexia bacterium]